jgi:hypothetical protein
MTLEKALAVLAATTLVLGPAVGWSHAQGVEPEPPDPQGETSAQASLGTQFTYQGDLKDGGAPANGTYDFEFELYDAEEDGAQVGATVPRADVDVEDGLFTVALDFGEVFDGTSLWLEVGVRPGDSGGGYTTLEPRQPLSGSPYALGLRPGAEVVGTPGLTGSLFKAEAAGGSYGGTLAQGLIFAPAGVYGYSSIGGMGLYGQTSNSSSTGYAVYGQHSGTGNGYGGYFVAAGEGNTAIYGTAPEMGINARATGETITSTAVLGDNSDDEFGTQNGAGVRGLAGFGGFGHVHPWTCPPDEDCYRRWHSAGGEFAGPNGVIAVGIQNDGAALIAAPSFLSQADAAWFYGNVIAHDNLEVRDALDVSGSKNFKIDHPQDPEEKYLYHASVESPERVNVYQGNVTTDEAGFATVELPDYFDALNRDPTYQLTVIGTFAQAIVAEEVKDNRFVIQTDEPRVKVSWQVTGVRNDAYARAHPFEDEVEKPAEEQGTYLQPEVHGQPEARSLETVKAAQGRGGQ